MEPATIPRPIPLTEQERRTIHRALDMAAAMSDALDWPQGGDTLRELGMFVLGDLDPEGAIR